MVMYVLNPHAGICIDELVEVKDSNNVSVKVGGVLWILKIIMG